MCKETEREVSELHLQYLASSLESFRKSCFSLSILNSGGVLALVGLFPVITRAGFDLASFAISIRPALFCFLAGLVCAISSHIAAYLSSHGAGWGNAAKEKTWRRIGFVLLISGLLAFALGAFLAVESLSDPSLRSSS